MGEGARLVGGGEVAAGGGLEEGEAEGGDDGVDVVEDVGLNVLEFDPFGGAGEEVDFDGETGGGGVELPHHVGESGIHYGKRGDIALEVGAEELQVDAPLGGVESGRKEPEGAQPLYFIGGGEAHGVGVDIEGAANAASAILRHGLMVAERFAHERVRGNGGDGIVEIAHLYGGERHILHRAVGAVGGHAYPVALGHHPVGRELHACHQAEYRILEHEHQHGRGRSQGSENGHGRLIYENAHAYYRTYAEHHKLRHLEDALYGVGLQVFATHKRPVEIVYENHYYPHHGPEHIEPRHHIDDIDRLAAVAREEAGKHYGNPDGGRKLAHSAGQAVIEHVVVPFGGTFVDEPFKGVEHPYRQIIEHDCREQNSDYNQSIGGCAVRLGAGSGGYEISYSGIHGKYILL